MKLFHTTWKLSRYLFINVLDITIKSAIFAVFGGILFILLGEDMKEYLYKQIGCNFFHDIIIEDYCAGDLARIDKEYILSQGYSIDKEGLIRSLSGRENLDGMYRNLGIELSNTDIKNYVMHSKNPYTSYENALFIFGFEEFEYLQGMDREILMYLNQFDSGIFDVTSAFAYICKSSINGIRSIYIDQQPNGCNNVQSFLYFFQNF